MDNELQKTQHPEARPEFSLTSQSLFSECFLNANVEDIHENKINIVSLLEKLLVEKTLCDPKIFSALLALKIILKNAVSSTLLKNTLFIHC